MVLIFPQTHVAVSLQAPDGNYAITNAIALLKCINQKDLFVPTCRLWDISELQKNTKKACRAWRASCLQQRWTVFRTMASCRLVLKGRKREEAAEEKDRQRVRNKLKKKESG